jgi:anti-anti-sigma factor
MFPHKSLFSASVVHENGSLVLALHGELDIATVPILRGAVGELLSPNLKMVTLELADLRFADVVGLRGLVEVKRMAGDVDAEFRLRSVGEFTRRVIRIARFVELEDAGDVVSNAS